MGDGGATLKAAGVTIILTTHYIEEAEAIADRIGIISKGEILLVEDEAADLMNRMGAEGDADRSGRAGRREIPRAAVEI